MGIYDNWTYTDLHQLNLDWLIREIKDLKTKTDSVSEAVETTTENAQAAQTAADLALNYLEQFRSESTAINDALAALEQTDALTAEELETIRNRLSTAENDIIAVSEKADLNSDRITNLATLSEGSTTGDAELIDGRVGYNGTTYSSIGNAIRGQAQGLYNMAVIGSNRSFTTPPTAPYDDANTIPTNMIVNYLGSANMPAHLPTLPTNQALIVTLSRANDHAYKSMSVQFLFTITTSGNVNGFFYRGCYGGANSPSWGNWTRITDGEVNTPVIANHELINSVEELVAPYDDLNSLQVNTITSYSGIMPANSPVSNGSFTVLTYGRAAANSRALTSLTMQLLVTNNNYDAVPQMWVRATYGPDAQYGAWTRMANATEISNSQGPIITPSLFNNLAVIGDSFATGRDNYNVSWLQMICRQYGCTGVNYSTSNLTTRTWLTDADGLAKLQNDSFVADLYFVALGINDSNPDSRHVDLGTIADMDASVLPDTFYGNMQAIYNAIKAKNANAAVCFITPQRIGDRYTPYANAVINIANKLGCLYIDSRSDGLIASSWWTNNLVNLHPTPPEYSALANSIVKGLSQAIYNNPAYLADYPTSVQ